METDASKIQTWFGEKESGEFQPLFQRMDEDFDIWEMNPSPSNISAYEQDVKTKTKQHPADIDVVSPDLRDHSDGVQSLLSDSDMQIMIKMAEAEGIDKRAEMGKLERLFIYLLEKADDRLRRLLLPPLRESIIWYLGVRGWAGVRVLLYKKDKSVIPDFVAFDPRWLVYDIGGEGLIKVGYKTFKSRAALKSEWDYEAESKTENEVIDYWEYEKPGQIINSVSCKGTFLKNPEVVNIPSMPFSIIPISTRPPVVGPSGTTLKSYGESLYATNRNINAVRNRFASIWVNHANLTANQPLINYRSKAGETIRDFRSYPGGVINLDRDENRLEPLPLKEISPTILSFMGWLNVQIEQGVLPRYLMETPPASGTRANLAQEAGNKIFNPQLKALSCIYADICRLIEEQLLAGKLKVNIKTEWDKKYYETQVTPIDLKRAHIIKVEFTARTPWSQLDVAQIAQMLKGLGLPDEWIWENILKIQDPKLISDLLALEIYEHSPQGMMKRAVDVLMDRGYIFEAQRLIKQMDIMEQQQAIGGEAPTAEAEIPPSEEVSPAPPEIPPEVGL